MLTPRGPAPAQPVPDPLPAGVRSGPRVRLPHREYLLYTGPAEEVTAPARLGDGLPGEDQTANLWWPDDQAWCVASEIDLGWSYLGGPAGLIGQVLADPRIEALPASPDDPVSRVEDWVDAWARAADGAADDGGHGHHRHVTRHDPGYAAPPVLAWFRVAGDKQFRGQRGQRRRQHAAQPGHGRGAA